MKHNGSLFSFILPITLFTMLGIIAFFQFTWLSDLQEKEEARLEARLKKNTINTANVLQDELLLLPTLVRTKATDYSSSLQRATDGIEFWKQHALEADIFSAIYFLDTGTGETIEIWKDNRFIPVAQPVKDEIYSAVQPVLDKEKNRFISILLTLPDGRIFLLSTVSLRVSPYYIICELDRESLTYSLIPRITGELFDESESYRFRIIDPRNSTLIYTSEKDYSPEMFANPDISWPLLPISNTEMYALTEPQRSINIEKFPDVPEKIFEILRNTLRYKKMMPDFFLQGLPHVPMTEQEAQNRQRPPDQLFLEVVHKEGSLYLASRNATAINAICSFAVVLILGAGMGILVRNTNRAQKLARSQQEFIATVTHELKTPLAVISSAAQNLSAGIITTEEKIKKYGNMIEKESGRLHNSIEYFLLYANINSSSRFVQRISDFSLIVQDTLAQSEALRNKLGFKTEIALPGEPIPVSCDPAALHSVVQNMVTNVLKHAKQGKYLGVSLTIEKAHSVKTDGLQKNAVLRIIDHGEGIPKKEQKHIFDPFVRGKYAVENQIEGNGVGLNLVKRIITLHSGTIRLEKSSLQGSTFVITIPTTV